MTTLEERLRGLSRLAAPPGPPVRQLADRASRRRRRRRAIAGGMIGCVAFLGIVAASAFFQDDDRPEPVIAGSGPPTSESGPALDEVMMPDVIGLPLGEAQERLSALGLVLRVAEPAPDQPGIRWDGDANARRAVVLASIPGTGTVVASGAVIGVRTALPDPPDRVECPGPDRPATSNADRRTAEQVLLDDRSDLLAPQTGMDVKAYLGQWTGSPSDVAGDPDAAAVSAFQIVVVYPTAASCPDEGSPSVSGVPVSRVFGPLSNWAGDPVPG